MGQSSDGLSSAPAEPERHMVLIAQGGVHGSGLAQHIQLCPLRHSYLDHTNKISACGKQVIAQ